MKIEKLQEKVKIGEYLVYQDKQVKITLKKLKRYTVNEMSNLKQGLLIKI